MIHIAAILLFAAPADTFKLQPLKETAPAAVAAPLRKALNETGSRIVDPEGKPYMDFWLRKSLPTAEPLDELGVSFGRIKQGSFIGVVRVHGRGSDFRGHKYPTGVYTMRYAWRPEDGDHQGTSDTRDFVLLSRLADDTAAGPVAEKALHERSIKVSSKKHPAVLYLVKWYEEGEAPRVFMNEENEHWLYECAVSAEKGGTALRLWIVIKGMAPEF